MELDFSEASVRELENHYDTVGYAIKGGNSPENIALLTRIWGAYLGEALRRGTGAEWIEEAGPNERRLGLKGRDGTVIYPHEVIRNRLFDNKAGNVLEFFQTARESLK